jgi:hypothetical protein
MALRFANRSVNPGQQVGPGLRGGHGSYLEWRSRTLFIPRA